MLAELFEKIRNKHEPIQRILLFVFAGLLLVWMLPKEGKFKFEYQKGKPWMHEDLIAPIDFAIKKPAEEIAAERERLTAEADVYLTIDRSIIDAKVSELERRLWSELNLDTTKNRQRKRWNNHMGTGSILIKRVFNKGILQSDPALEDLGNRQSVYLLDGNNAQAVNIDDLYSVQSAYEYSKGRVAAYPELKQDILNGIIAELLVQNVHYNPETTDRNLQQDLDNIAESRGMVAQGQAIIKRGDIVDEDRFQVLESLRQENEKQLGSSESYYLLLLGQFILVALCLICLFFYLVKYRTDIANDSKQTTFLLLMVLLMVLCVSIVRKFPALSVNVVPFMLLPVIIRNFFDSRTALFTHVVTVIIIGFEVPNGYQFLFMQITAGIIALFTLINLQSRGQLFKSMIIVFGVYCASYFSMAIMQEGTIADIDAKMFIWLAGSVGLTFLAYPMIFVLEKMFGIVSDVTLLELSNTNHTLLREMATEAPGTFQHSLQVANLAESAVFEVGGNPLLVRTGALYHDIGKLYAPMYFIENQVTGVNPHDDLSFEESAKIIIDHVIKGIEKGKAAGLPEIIIDFIRTHHGTTTVQYFYRSYLRDFPEGELDKEHFSYPGPKPFTKEMAVLMMADSVEAASRSLKEYTPEKLEELIGNIIDSQMKEGQFDGADITLADITTIRSVFKTKLMNAYHVRVEYPS